MMLYISGQVTLQLSYTMGGFRFPISSCDSVTLGSASFVSPSLP